MWIVASLRTTTLRQNILSLSNLPAKRGKSIWSSEEGRTENEGCTVILVLHLESSIYKGQKRRFERKLENFFDKVLSFFFGSGRTIVYSITHNTSDVETLSPLLSSYFFFNTLFSILFSCLFSSWLPPSLGSLINLFLNLSISIFTTVNLYSRLSQLKTVRFCLVHLWIFD